MNLLDNISSIVFLNANFVHILNVLGKFLISLVVSVINGASIKVNDTSEAVVVINGGGSSDFSTESVTTDGSQSDLVLIHEAHDIIRRVL